MNMLPEDILNKIMLFNSHPVADILKASTIFKYRQLRELYYSVDDDDERDVETKFFDEGCDSAFSDGEYSFDDVCGYHHFMKDKFDIKKCLYYYNIGYMHTIIRNIENENDDDVRHCFFPYKFNAINDVPNI